ncbi:MAG TPA: hypothetical protein PLI95_03910 [Polyangiaceae bacterium]|mgnify:CR=1 FL=1|nr:hypothetical protein [Polyangiaceae bacterium]
MQAGLDAALIVVVLTCLNLLGSSRVRHCIKLLAFQGVALGLLPLFELGVLTAPSTVFFVAVGIALRGMAFPWLLMRAQKQANVRREVEPYVGFGSSLLFGALALLLSAWLSIRLPLPHPPPSPLALPVALFCGLVGLFLTISRRKAINQALGYLVLENGIFAFGVMLVHGQPMLVELGVLLDVFGALFVMGIAIFHISREFDHIDADRLAVLKD